MATTEEQTKQLFETITKDCRNSKISPLFPMQILADLNRTKIAFEITLSLEELWQQEKHYYLKFGVSAFDAGYIHGIKALNDSKF